MRIKYKHIEEALNEKLARENPTFKTDQKVLTIEELEKKQAAENWMKQQQMYQKNPNQKKNNIFMQHLTRQESHNNEEDVDMEEELLQ